MKKFIIIFCTILLAILCAFILWRTIFLGTYELRPYSRILVSGHYDSEFASGFLKSEEELNQLLLEVGSTNHVPTIDYAQYMWVYSPHEAEKILYSTGAGMIFIKPTKTPIEGTSIYLVRVRRKDAAGPKPMAPTK